MRGKDAVVLVPVFPRRRHEIRQTIEELKRCELDDAIGPRPHGLPPATPPDPVSRLVSRQDVADTTDPAVWAADRGQSLQCEGGPCVLPQQVFKAPKIAGHIAVEERDPDSRID